MIKKYSNFILESKKIEVRLLLEGMMSATSEFLQKLKKISKEKGEVGKIASEIYEFIESGCWVNDSELKQNYFNTTEKDDMVSFLMNSKLPDDWDEEVDPSYPYTAKGRGQVKIGKIIRYLLNLMNEIGEREYREPKDKDIEDFVNVYKSTTVSSNFKFEKLKGNDIAKYYNNKKYLSASGSLGGSCMADESKSVFKIYSQNESKVSLLVYIDEEKDKISGRALLWKLDKSPCGAKYFMDRVYTNSDSDFFKFKEYAEENGYLYKFVMNSHIDENVHFRYKGGEVFGEITVKLDGKAKYYPFVDTMCFLNKDEDELSNVPTPECYMLHSVSGEKEECDRCNGQCFECDDCGGSGEITCVDCEDGDTDSGKCVSCKGEGWIKCKHDENAELCSTCGEGVSILKAKGIETKVSKLIDNKKR